jgi:hypothetical protein
VRAYFTFQLDADAADQNRGHGGGFTFALVDGKQRPAVLRRRHGQR